MNELIQLGLTENEAKVYVMLLRTGVSPASSLAKRIGLKRVTIYNILDSLCSKGLVTYEQSKRAKQYIALDPDYLLYGLQRQNAELKTRMDLARECIEQLHEFSPQMNYPKRKVYYFRGSSMARAALNEAINVDEKLMVLFLDFGNKGETTQFLDLFLKNKKLNGIVFVPKTKEAIALRQFPHFNVKGVGMSLVKSSGEIVIQGETLFFISSDGKDLQMMQICDPYYSRYLLEVFGFTS